MGLTLNSTGYSSSTKGLIIKKEHDTDVIVALAGNPNVGKSTVFNALTGLNQHTGNWPGKTVTTAQGKHTYKGRNYILVDLPGTYSLMAHSAEEEAARDFICFGSADCVIVVCDATCLERNLNLTLQTIEITKNVVVCVNLIDEAKKKHIKIDLCQLEKELGVPVIGTTARSGKGLSLIMDKVNEIINEKSSLNPIEIKYISPIEKAIDILLPVIKNKLNIEVNPRWVAIKLLDYDKVLIDSLSESIGCDIANDSEVQLALEKAHALLNSEGISKENLRDRIVSCVVLMAEGICNDVVCSEHCCSISRDRKIDRILTNKWTGIPIMLLLLVGIFWLTITGANYPSALLSDGLFWIENRLTDFFIWLGTPEWVHGVLILGIYRVLAWVVSVMLPPMAIFFPLFTLLEDFGYLPRVAFNLDKQFKKASTCGKQSLTMCIDLTNLYYKKSQPIYDYALIL